MAKNWTYNEETHVLTRTYMQKVVNKETGKETQVEAAEALEMALDDLFPNMDWAQADEVEVGLAVNGTKQKMDDAIAKSKDEKLTEAEKRDVQSALLDRLQNQRKWNMEGKAGGTRGPAVPLKISVPPLLEAFIKLGMSQEEAEQKLAKAFGKSLEVIQKFIETGEEED
jgi:hypothetical protein